MADSFLKETDLKYTEMKPFRAWVQMTLPQVYNDALSYQELAYKVLYYINELISNNDYLLDRIKNLNEAYILLEEYVNTYFENLDLTEEINARLDEYVENGTFEKLLESILENYNLTGITCSTEIHANYRGTFYRNKDDGKEECQGLCHMYDDVVAMYFSPDTYTLTNEGSIIVYDCGTHKVISETDLVGVGHGSTIAYVEYGDKQYFVFNSYYIDDSGSTYNGQELRIVNVNDYSVTTKPTKRVYTRVYYNKAEGVFYGLTGTGNLYTLEVSEIFDGDTKTSVTETFVCQAVDIPSSWQGFAVYNEEFYIMTTSTGVLNVYNFEGELVRYLLIPYTDSCQHLLYYPEGLAFNEETGDCYFNSWFYAKLSGDDSGAVFANYIDSFNLEKGEDIPLGRGYMHNGAYIGDVTIGVGDNEHLCTGTYDNPIKFIREVQHRYMPIKNFRCRNTGDYSQGTVYFNGDFTAYGDFLFQALYMNGGSFKIRGVVTVEGTLSLYDGILMCQTLTFNGSTKPTIIRSILNIATINTPNTYIETNRSSLVGDVVTMGTAIYTISITNTIEGIGSITYYNVIGFGTGINYCNVACRDGIITISRNSATGGATFKINSVYSFENASYPLNVDNLTITSSQRIG